MKCQSPKQLPRAEKSTNKRRSDRFQGCPLSHLRL